MGGKTTLKTRQNALDSLTSEWVRRRYADEAGMVLCVTCGARMHWKEANAGHFWKRQHQATRYDCRNLNVQCVRCNKWQGGREAEHAAYILRTLGEVGFRELEELHRQTKKWSRKEIESLIEARKADLSSLQS